MSADVTGSPSLREIAEELREHILDTYECDEFGEDRWRDDGRYDYAIDLAAGRTELVERQYGEPTGRELMVEVDVRVYPLAERRPIEPGDWVTYTPPEPPTSHYWIPRVGRTFLVVATSVWDGEAMVHVWAAEPPIMGEGIGDVISFKASSATLTSRPVTS